VQTVARAVPGLGKAFVKKEEETTASLYTRAAVPGLSPPERPASLAALLAITFLGSMSGGTFWGGLYFVTAEAYHFSPERNLALGALMGAIAALGASSAARLAARLAPRTVLVGVLAAWSVVAFLPVAVPQSQAILWLTALVGGATSATLWPIVESYVSAGRHGADMRAAIGWFNITWTPAVAVPLFLLPVIAQVGLTWSLGLAGIVNLLAIAVVLTLPPRPAGHEPEAARAATGTEYPALARATTWLLPLSYVFSTTLAPVLPYRLTALGLGPQASVVAALWMAARFGTFLVMWRSGFWHGRWGTLVAGSVGVALGIGLVMLAPSITLAVIGLIVFGVGMGLIYYAALYYSLTVGHAAVDAGGKFEALVGVGSSIGPLLGILGHVLTKTRPEITTVALSLGVFVLALPSIVHPYRQARARRPAKR